MMSSLIVCPSVSGLLRRTSSRAAASLDHLDAGVVPRRQPAAAVRRIVDELAAELVKGLGEDVHGDRAIPHLTQEPLSAAESYT